ncbi:MAG: hypothetical protein HKN23_15735 [Verrucomicrobiales bacterium]|nr:hypothetical protein [Verrucomicrobiales bacterium]
MPEDVTKSELEELIALLEQRLAIIGDAGLRESDPDAQLEQLKNVSESIFELHGKLKGRIPPRLEHFLEGCSYEKAMGWARGMLREIDS